PVGDREARSVVADDRSRYPRIAVSGKKLLYYQISRNRVADSLTNVFGGKRSLRRITKAYRGIDSCSKYGVFHVEAQLLDPERVVRRPLVRRPGGEKTRLGLQSVLCIENAYRACLESGNSIIRTRYVFDVIVLNLKSSPTLKSSLPVLRKIKVVIIPRQMICLSRRIIADELVGPRSNRPTTNPSVERVGPPVCIRNTRQHV